MVGSWQGQGKRMTCPSWHCPAGSVLHPLLPLAHASALGPALLVLSISPQKAGSHGSRAWALASSPGWAQEEVWSQG